MADIGPAAHIGQMIKRIYNFQAGKDVRKFRSGQRCTDTREICGRACKKQKRAPCRFLQGAPSAEKPEQRP
ncbi:hypothetical protein DWV16_16925 [Anaerotruncus sp. AF02-27]|nr:hypothetical protein DWV16_16925 [Anaerotruncus sp. AF02-27]